MVYGRIRAGGGILLAILLVSIKADIKTLLKINIWSQVDLATVTEELREKEDKGFLGTKNTGLLRTALEHLRMHRSTISFQDIKDLPNETEERTAELLAKSALQNDRLMILPPIPMELHLMGAKLSKVTQALAYKTIKQNTPSNYK